VYELHPSLQNLRGAIGDRMEKGESSSVLKKRNEELSSSPLYPPQKKLKERKGDRLIYFLVNY